jgi:hypothetical protein
LLPLKSYKIQIYDVKPLRGLKTLCISSIFLRFVRLIAR